MRDGAFVDETRLTGGTSGISVLWPAGGLSHGPGSPCLPPGGERSPSAPGRSRDVAHCDLGRDDHAHTGTRPARGDEPPYQQTRAATGGPDIVANIIPATQNATGPVTQRQLVALSALDHAPGVVGHSGPYPVTWALLRAQGLTAGAEIEGRDTAKVAIDQPKVTEGTWLRDGGVVVEQSFAEALGIKAGDSITLNDHSFPSWASPSPRHSLLIPISAWRAVI